MVGAHIDASAGARIGAGIDAYIGLGSNLGSREGHLAAALAALAGLPQCELVAVSAVYETQPVGGPPQPAYLNAAAQLRTALPASALLEQLLAIEAARGRIRTAERFGPRTLDLDLLLYGDCVIDEPDLVVPHPRLCERSFALEPLLDLAPGRLHPLRGESLRSLALRVREPGVLRCTGPGEALRSGGLRSASPPWAPAAREL